MSFDPTPLSDYLSKDQLDKIENYYTTHEEHSPHDLFVSEPSMQGASEIQQSMSSGVVSHNVVLQEMVLSRDRERAWSRGFLEKLPAGLIMPLAMVCLTKVAELFADYQKQAEEALKGEKKK